MHALDIGWLVGALLISARLGGIAVFSPPLGGGLVPASIRLCIVIAFSAVLARTPVALPQAASTGPSLALLLVAMASEFALGATMALGACIGFAVFTFGARLLDVQAGFGMGQVLDPMTRQQLPVLSAALHQLALLIFFLLDGHHALLRGVMASLEHVPPGAVWSLEGAFAGLLRLLTQLFSLGLAMVAPVVFCLLLVEAGLGVMSRSLPQMNVLLLGLPVKVMVAFAALAVWLASGATGVSRPFALVFAAWESIWR